MKIRRKIAVALATAAATALALAGCSMTTATGSATSPTNSSAVGMTFADLSNPVWAELVKEAQSYGSSKGLQVTYVDAQNSSATQVTQIENFIQQGVGAIVVCAVDSNAVENVLKQARAKGIKVVGYTQTLKNVDSQYLVDAYKTGYANGESAAKWINAHYAGQSIEWGLMDLPKFPEIIKRADGIKDAMAKLAPAAKLVATAPALTTADGVTNAETFLQAHPNMKVIATIGGGGASGADQGVKSAGVTDLSSFGVFGIDSTQIEVQDIINGGAEKATISLGGGKEHGRKLIDITKSLLNGKKTEKDQYMPITVVDASNAKDYYSEVFGN